MAWESKIRLVAALRAKLDALGVDSEIVAFVANEVPVKRVSIAFALERSEHWVGLAIQRVQLRARHSPALRARVQALRREIARALG